MIDYKNYLDMDSQDLKKLMEHAQNILDVRQQDEIDAMNNCDIKALLKTFEQNEARELSDEVWKKFNINKINLDNIEFFEFIRTLSQYPEKNAENHYSYEEKMATKAFNSVAYLNYFLDKEEYQSFIVKEIKNGEPMKNLSQQNTEVMDVLIQKGLVTPAHDILDQIKQWGQPRAFMGYLEYALTRHNIALPQNQAQDFFKRYWSQCSPNLINMMHKQYCAELKINMDDAVKSYSDTAYPDEFKMYNNFVRTSRERFSQALKIFEIPSDSIYKIMKSMRATISNAQNENDSDAQCAQDNLAELCSYVDEHMPEVRKMMTTYSQDDRFPKFKQITSRMLLYIQFNQDIPLADENAHSENHLRAPKI